MKLLERIRRHKYERKMRPRREIAIALAIGAINSLAGDVPGLTTETPEVRELIEKIGAGECDRTARSIFGMHEIDQQDLTNGYRQPDEPSMVRRYFDPRSQAEAEYDANGNFTRVFVKRDEIGGGLEISILHGGRQRLF
ncbi:hypothetical protein FWD20_03770 [Candidatus Saccharibacteria bacterium]|nr:hypothetical protein [Candidatus Saccharibacteria bacterium]